MGCGIPLADTESSALPAYVDPFYESARGAWELEDVKVVYFEIFRVHDTYHKTRENIGKGLVTTVTACGQSREHPVQANMYL